MKRKHLSPSFRVVLVTFHVQFFLIIFYVSSSMVAESDLFLLRQLVSSPRAQKVKINLSSIVLEQVQGLSSRRSESICYSISPFFARADQISNHLPGTPSSIPNIDGCVISVTMTVSFLVCFPGGKQGLEYKPMHGPPSSLLMPRTSYLTAEIHFFCVYLFRGTAGYCLVKDV